VQRFSEKALSREDISIVPLLFNFSHPPSGSHSRVATYILRIPILFEISPRCPRDVFSFAGEHLPNLALFSMAKSCHSTSAGGNTADSSGQSPVGAALVAKGAPAAPVSEGDMKPRAKTADDLFPVSQLTIVRNPRYAEQFDSC
jgi:hypothetical protein